MGLDRLGFEPESGRSTTGFKLKERRKYSAKTPAFVSWFPGSADWQPKAISTPGGLPGLKNGSGKVTLLQPIYFMYDMLTVAAFAFLDAKRTYPPGCFPRNE
jgi:hypothetical protein